MSIYQLSVVLAVTLVFFILWWLIGKLPVAIARKLQSFRDNVQKLRNSFPKDSTLHVHSGETPNGKEVEFIDDRLPEAERIVRLLRILLICSYVILMAYLIASQVNHFQF